VKIGVDLQAIQGQYGDRGIGFYNESLFKKIIVEKPADMDFFWFLQPHKPVPAFAAYSGRHIFVPATAKPDYWYAEKICDLKLDVMHCTCPFGDFPVPKISNLGCGTVATIYDLIPLKLPFYFDIAINRADYMNRLQILKTYQTLLTISSSVKDDIIRYLSYPAAKIKVIGAGVDEDFINCGSGGDFVLRNKLLTTQPYLLCTGGDDPRKNLMRLIEAFGLLQPRHANYKLVIVCDLSPSTKKALLAQAAAVGVQDRLILTGFVPKATLIALYRFAEVFVFPSLAEGFGLPILEAMACGTPVVTSYGRPFTEVAGDAAIYFDPHNPHSIASAISSVLDYKAARYLLSQKGLKRATSKTWAPVAQTVLAAYSEAARYNRIMEIYPHSQLAERECILATISRQKQATQPAAAAVPVSVAAPVSAASRGSASALSSVSTLASGSMMNTTSATAPPSESATKDPNTKIWPAPAHRKGTVFIYLS
jgi:glycosyltransferase involved in cell wall biosynthesis